MQTATNRIVLWSWRKGVYRFTYVRDGETYEYACRAKFRRECLRAISLDACNAELSLDHHDAAMLTKLVREVVQVESEAAPVEIAAIVSRGVCAAWLAAVAAWCVSRFFARG